MYPPVWGHHMWATIHLMAHVYPQKPSDKRKKSMENFLLNMCDNLPCPGCGMHCGMYMKEHPPHVETQGALKKWAIDFHNTVNKRTGKRELTYEEAEKVLHENFFQKQDWVELKRAQEMRREDHAAIDKWKLLAESVILASPHNTETPEPCSSNTVSNITIGVIGLLVFIALLALIIVRHRKCGG